MSQTPAFTPLPRAERRAIYRQMRSEARMIGRLDPWPVRWLKVALMEAIFYSTMICVAGALVGLGAAVSYLVWLSFGVVAG